MKIRIQQQSPWNRFGRSPIQGRRNCTVELMHPQSLVGKKLALKYQVVTSQVVRYLAHLGGSSSTNRHISICRELMHTILRPRRYGERCGKDFYHLPGATWSLDRSVQPAHSLASLSNKMHTIQLHARDWNTLDLPVLYCGGGLVDKSPTGIGTAGRNTSGSILPLHLHQHQNHSHPIRFKTRLHPQSHHPHQRHFQHSSLFSLLSTKYATVNRLRFQP